jgi:high affinity choline transporter 7
MDQVDWGGVALVVTLYTIFFLVGWLAIGRLKNRDASDLLVAGRSMPVWIAVITMTATWVDGGYLLGTAEYTFQYGLAYGAQGGVCFGMSLIVGGLFFAARMRRMEFSTMVDAFDVRLGPRWAAVLSLPAMLGELLWSGALLVAIGATFGELLNLDLTSAILLSAIVVTSYTIVGGIWSVAYTDIVQFVLIPLGLLAALPFALEQAGGFSHAIQTYVDGHQSTSRLLPPLRDAGNYWTVPTIVAWWDMTIMLIFGGIPWNCYFQRVLSCQTPAKARRHSILAGLLTTSLTVPPILLGIAAFAIYGPNGIEPASTTLPRLLSSNVPYVVMLLGMSAIVGAVTSSFSASILSAGALLSWNIYRPLLAPQASAAQIKLVIRLSILGLGVAAVVLALQVKSVAALWLFTADLVFVLLFPQLVMTLFDRKTNLTGSMFAFFVSLVLRLGGGMSLQSDDRVIGFGAFIPYAEIFAGILPGSPSDWYDSIGATHFPVRTVAMLSGLIILPLVSRLAPARYRGEDAATA